MDDSILELKNISKAFPGVQALKDVDLKIKANSVHALVGENGAGKSTMIKILSGVYKADSGKIIINGIETKFNNPLDSLKAGISTIYQELSVIDDLTIAQDLFFGEEEKFTSFGFINFKRMNKEAKAVLNNLGIILDVAKKVESLSISDKQQLEIAKAVNRNAKIVLMDEPTSALSDKEIENLFKIIKKIKQGGVSIIYISHHLDEIFKICDDVTILRDGRVVDTLKVVDGQEVRDEVIKKMVGKDIVKIKTNRFREIHSDKKVLLVNNYNTSTGVKDASFELKHGEVLGIYGAMGSKRTELFKSIFTGRDKISGEVLLDSKEVGDSDAAKSISNGVGFLPEDKKSEGLFLNLPISKNIPFILYGIESKLGFLKQRAGAKATKKYIDLLSIKTPSSDQEVIYLSGGNQQKVVLAKLLAANCSILMLDEPLVGIDVGTKNEILDIINKLANEGKSIIIISSELPELMKISDRILIMRGGKIIKEISGEFNQEEIISYSVGGKSNEHD
ncbi:MAG: sugar ABC transporter ATP-binding protein [Actinobacteria bacterium]|nr:sugar ABC transporter ATP-binding protein [Actinomycetota bacterium]